jgi:hypothetical protein
MRDGIAAEPLLSSRVSLFCHGTANRLKKAIYVAWK